MHQKRKAACLLPMGLFCAAVLYPFLHELGHSLTAIAFGAEVMEVRWLPLPSILCGMDPGNVVGYAAVGMGGITFPAVLSLLSRPIRRFWPWYAAFVIKLICIWSLLLSACSILLFRIGIVVPKDDMAQIMRRHPDWGPLYAVWVAVLLLALSVSLIRSKPLQRIMREI